jgi:hypothetical protein
VGWESLGVDLPEKEFVFGTAFNNALKFVNNINAHCFFEVMSECGEQRMLLGNRQFNSPLEPKSTHWQEQKDLRFGGHSSRVLQPRLSPNACHDPLQSAFRLWP